MEFFRADHFQAEVVERKWDRVKLVCRQPFKYNNDVFGLAMLVLHGESEVGGAGEPGSLAGPAVSSLKEFKRKTESLTSSASPTPHIPAVLQNLENRRKFLECICLTLDKYPITSFLNEDEERLSEIDQLRSYCFNIINNRFHLSLLFKNNEVTNHHTTTD